MKTKVNEVTDGIYRISTLVPDIGPTGFTVNQFLVRAEEPLLFHTGDGRSGGGKVLVNHDAQCRCGKSDPGWGVSMDFPVDVQR